ncbi:MAG: PfkB family carbohydrate kinase [Spirochaetota bacterium]
MFDVVGVGCNAIDYLCLMPDFPDEDTKLEVDAIEMQGGGNIGTALVAVSRLGGSAAFCAAVGDDGYRGEVLDALREEGVDVSPVAVKAGANPRAFIMINRRRSSRTIIYTRKNVPPFMPEDLDPAVIASARVLLVDFYYPEASAAAAGMARRHGIPVVVDAESVPPQAGRVLERATHLVASLPFARRFTGLPGSTQPEQLLEALADSTGVPFTCITLGERGAVALGPDRELIVQKAYPVKTVDTTGAGDVFHGAFSYALGRGWPERRALVLSAACAALKCESLGGRKGIPGMLRVEEFLRSRGEPLEPFDR